MRKQVFVMRKIIVSILLVLTVALALPMASCNGNGGKNDYRISDPVGADATAETSADADTKDRMIKEGLATDKTIFCCNHFSHSGRATHDEFVPAAAEKGFLVAYDSMEYEF